MYADWFTRPLPVGVGLADGFPLARSLLGSVKNNLLGEMAR
jgi:hypothetical protein